MNNEEYPEENDDNISPDEDEENGGFH